MRISQLTFFICFLPHLLVGQVLTLQGYVAEKNGRLLNRAKLTITGSKYSKEIRTESPNGWYNLKLAKGTYDVTVEFPGYHEQRETVTIENKNVSLNFELSPKTAPSRLDQDTLRVGMVYDPPLFWFREKSAEPYKDKLGLNVEIVNEDTLGLAFVMINMLRKELQKPVKYTLIGYVESPELLINGELDLLIGGFIPSLHYPKSILWSLQFMEANFRLIVPKGSPINEFEDLVKFDSILTLGHYNEPVVKDWISQNLPKALARDYEVSDWYKHLVAGEIDAIINEYPYAKESIKPNLEVLDMLPGDLNEQGYAICLPPKDYRLLNEVNHREDTAMPSSKHLLTKDSDLTQNQRISSTKSEKTAPKFWL